LLLDVEPGAETVEVDEADGAGALAGGEERVGLVCTRLPTKSTPLQFLF
jgi:hypothetical protein